MSSLSEHCCELFEVSLEHKLPSFIECSTRIREDHLNVALTEMALESGFELY